MKTIRLTTRLPEDLHQAITERAERNENSLNGEFIFLLRLALDKRLAPVGTDNFWYLSPEERVAILLDAAGTYVTREKSDD